MKKDSWKKYKDNKINVYIDSGKNRDSEKNSRKENGDSETESGKKDIVEKNIEIMEKIEIVKKKQR